MANRPVLRTMYRFILFLFCVLVFACNDDKDRPKVSGIKADVTIERFEPAFFEIDTNRIAQGLVQLRTAYPGFYPAFMRDILGVNPTDPASHAVIRSVLTAYAGINDSLQRKYKNVEELRKELVAGFKLVKYYYPTYTVPRIITFVATLDAPGVVLTPEYIGIGLHQFAGKNFLAYRDPAVQQLYPAYISRRFDQEYITANVMKAVATDLYPEAAAGKPLIEQMVEKGKQWYLLNRFLPDAPDSVKTGFTGRQLKWADENEGNVWAFLLKNENVYSVEPATIQTYLGEAPFTQGMPDASPGNIGQWIGWRIVERFAEKNPELSVQQVLGTPPRQLFDGAGYRPK